MLSRDLHQILLKHGSETINKNKRAYGNESVGATHIKEWYHYLIWLNLS